MKRVKFILKIAAGVVLLAIFLGTVGFLYNKSKAKPVVYETTTPIKTDIVKKTTATGSVIPRKEIEIKPKVSGIIEEIYVVAGQSIRRGDLIAKVKIIPDMVNLNNAETRLNRARIGLEDSKRTYDRQKELYNSKVIPKTDYETAEIAYKNAGEEVEAAENNLQLIKEGQLKKAGSATNTIITSTIDGMVLDIPVEVGNSVIESNTFNDGTTIAIVADMGEMIFEGKVDESEVGKIEEGMNLILTIGAFENVKFNAALEHISPKGALENGAIQFTIKAAVELIDTLFVRSGYSANAAIVLDKRDSVMAVSESLVTFEGDSAFVELETAPQQFDKRYIKTGLSDGINIEVLSGLTMTDKIKKPDKVLK